MKTIISTLPGITDIYIIDASDLPARVDLWCIIRRPVPILTRLTPIPWTDTPTCNLTQERINTGIKQTALLTFKTPAPLPYHKNPAFVIRTPDGNTYLIGSRERPHPTIHTTQTTGAPAADPAALTHTITHKALRTLIPCHIP
ncbi:MAG: hypothetical protein HDS14_05950 [Bacteroides sp.]|nr:hypothetical protein [Bacteroides sp.]